MPLVKFPHPGTFRKTLLGTKNVLGEQGPKSGGVKSVCTTGIVRSLRVGFCFSTVVLVFAGVFVFVVVVVEEEEEEDLVCGILGLGT